MHAKGTRPGQLEWMRDNGRAVKTRLAQWHPRSDMGSKREVEQVGGPGGPWPHRRQWSGWAGHRAWLVRAAAVSEFALLQMTIRPSAAVFQYMGRMYQGAIRAVHSAAHTKIHAETRALAVQIWLKRIKRAWVLHLAVRPRQVCARRPMPPAGAMVDTGRFRFMVLSTPWRPGTPGSATVLSFCKGAFRSISMTWWNHPAFNSRSASGQLQAALDGAPSSRHHPSSSHALRQYQPLDWMRGPV